MRYLHKEVGGPSNKAQRFGCRLEDWSKKVVIFSPDQAAQPYIAHKSERAFHEPHNPPRRVHERYDTDVTRMIF